MTYNNDSNEKCAIKILKPKYQEYSRQEIYYLKKIGSHKNIIPIQDYFKSILFFFFKVFCKFKNCYF